MPDGVPFLSWVGGGGLGFRMDSRRGVKASSSRVRGSGEDRASSSSLCGCCLPSRKTLRRFDGGSEAGVPATGPAMAAVKHTKSRVFLACELAPSFFCLPGQARHPRRHTKQALGTSALLTSAGSHKALQRQRSFGRQVGR